MTLYIKLDSEFEHGSAISFEDPVLTNGSLLLLEPARDSRDNVGVYLNNYASKQARDLGVAADKVEITGSLGGKGILEKTAKGGLHGIVTRGAVSNEKKIIESESIIDYMKANANHSYAAIATIKMTRDLTVISGQKNTHIFFGSESLGFAMYQAANSGNIGYVPFTSGSDRLDTYNKVDSGYRSHGLSVSRVLSSFSGDNMLVGWGAVDGRNEGLNSFVLYRLYIEDLTVSGRTLSDVVTIYERLVNDRFSSDDLYANDSFTDPNSSGY